MNIRSFFIAFTFIVGLTLYNQVGRIKYISPVNPASGEKTVSLFHFIQDMQGKYMLSGQHNFIGKGSEYSDMLEEMTGKKAIIWGADFSFCIEGENEMHY